MLKDIHQSVHRLSRPGAPEKSGLPLLSRTRKPVTRSSPSHPESALSTGSLQAYLTQCRKEISAAQKLRYQVFTEEYGARIPSLTRKDRDRFDRFCRHLVVKDLNSNRIVGYTRILLPQELPPHFPLYSAGEFELPQQMDIRKDIAEIGRTCIDPAFRQGPTIAVLWSALARFLLEHKIERLVGCASISLKDGGGNALATMQLIRDRYFTDPHLRVSPRVPLPPLSTLATGKLPQPILPPLLKTYLKMGARVAGEACWDKAFNVADVFIVLEMNRLPKRYRQHFLKAA